MSLTIQYSDPRGVTEPAIMVSLGSNLRLGEMGLAMAAEVGDVATSTVNLEDPGGIYDFVGYRAMDFRETSAPSNNRIIGRFVIQDREVGRSRERALLTERDRLWTVDLADFNWHLGKRLHTDADADRPAESAGARLTWLLTSAAGIDLHDYGNVEYPTEDVDASDFRSQRAVDTLADCAIEGGYLFWCDINEAAGRPELFFLDPNGSSYASDLFISNVLGEADGVTTFAPSRDARLRRSPSRITYGALVAFRNGWVYEVNSVVGEQFAKVDQAAPMVNVKTAARARRIARKFLNDNDEETDVLTWSVWVPAAQVNDIRHGHRLAVKFEHLPGYEEGRWVRVVRRSVLQEEMNGGAGYRLDLTAIPSGPDDVHPAPPFTGSAFAGAMLSQEYDPGNVLGFNHDGDTPPSGWFATPTVGPLSVIGGSAPFVSILVEQDMDDLRIEVAAFFTTVAENASVQMTVTSSVQGTLGSDTDSYVGGLTSFNGTLYINLPSIGPVVAGEVITIAGTYSGFLTGGWSDSGTNATYFRVGRGTHYWGGGPLPAQTWVGPS